MRTVNVTHTIRATVHEAESCWYDVDRWPAWIDGLAHVSQVTPEWPAVGATVIWESGPAGRGTVTERVLEHVPLQGQTVEVEDQSIDARQTVSFSPAPDGVRIELSLRYQVRERSIFTPVVDLLFIRGAIERSLRTTLARFGAELAATRQSGAR